LNEQYGQVKLEALNKGDVVHVSFDSHLERRLYLNQTVTRVTGAYLFTEDGRSFYRDYGRFYLVEKAKKTLPTKIGSVVKHPDGWRFIRLDEDNWKGIDPEQGISPFIWSDAEVESDDWEEVV